MATPLRKEEPEFGDEEITSADLALPKRPVSDMRGPQAVVNDGGFEQNIRTTESARIAENARTSDLATSDLATSNLARTSEQSTNTNETARLFPGNELEGLRTRWKEVQTAFVDEPRKAVEQADGLVASAMKRIAEVFAEERAGLEKQWDRGDNVSTEDLRVAMQRYRTFFERLLSI
jgi:hypothetical protein